MSKKQRVRPLAICVFRNRGRILVMEGYDKVKKEYFYRPLGGKIEFGESSIETICRELMEEINVDVDSESLRYLGTVENIFTFNSRPGHEIVLIYDGAFKDAGLYKLDVIVGRDVKGGKFRAIWKNIIDFGAGKAILYPTGLLEMLMKEKNE